MISRLKLKIVVPILAVLIAALSGSVAWVSQAGGSAAPPYLSYAVKFACGNFGKLIPASAAEVPEGPVKPGDYQTAINVHNPSATLSIQFNKKAVLLYRQPQPVPETQLEAPKPPRDDHQASLPADFGMLIDCQDIRAVLLTTASFVPPPAPGFIEGWVIIQEPTTVTGGPALPPLDVTALYTSHGYNCTVDAASNTCAPDSVTRTGFSENVVTITPTQVSQ